MKRILFFFCCIASSALHAQITLDYTTQTGSFNATQTVNTNGSYFAGGFNNNSTELGTYANGNGGGYVGDPGVALFRTFTTAASGNSGTARAMQVGDEFSITCYVGNSSSFYNNSNAGISFNGGTSNGSFSNYNSLQRAKFQINQNGNWFSAASSAGTGYATPGQDVTFRLKLTSAKTANLTISSGNGATTYDMVLANSPGTSGNIQSFVIWNQTSGNNNNMFWKNASLKTTGTVEIGNGNGTSTFDGVISDGANPNSTTINVPNDVTKSGTGTITFSAANTYTGATRITGGSIKLSGSGTLGSGSNVYISSGASLNLDGVNATVASVQETGSNNGGTIALGSGTLTVTGGWSGTKYQNSISGTGNITKQGTGTLTLYGTQSYTGTTTVTGGELSSGVAMASANYVINGGTLKLNTANILPDTATVSIASGTFDVANDDTIANLTITGGTVTVAAGKVLTINGNLTLSATGTITLGTGAAIRYGNSSTLIYNTGGAVAVSETEWPSTNAPHAVVVNSGTLTFSESHVTGDVTINAGTLDIGSHSLNRASAGGTFTVANGATLKIGGMQTFPLNYATHAIGASSTIEYSGTAQAVAALNSSQTYGNLIISGSGTKTLAGNTSAGAFTLNAGTLDLGSNSLSRPSAGGSFIMASGTTLRIGGTNTFPANYTTYSLNVGSTTEYYGGVQEVAVLPSAQKYGHIILSGTGAKTLAGNVTAAGNLTVNSVALDVAPEQTLTVEGNIANNSGTVTFANNANLLQGTATTVNGNTGNAFVYRDGSPLYRNDFTLWSSPVAAQNLFEFSPSTLPDRFYFYNTATNQYNVVPGLGDESETTFETGRGYLIRMPNAGMSGGVPTGTTTNPADYQNGLVTMTHNGKFTGVPNSGTITVALNTASTGYNLVGNPYPSPISIGAFQAANGNAINGSIWIWRKRSVPATPNTAYVTINSAGVYVGNGQPEQEDPNGILRTGQGFFVQLKTGYTTSDLVFTNSMRSNDTANQFFRQANQQQTAVMPEAHGIWLTLTNTAGIYSQMYTGYIDGATNGEDSGLDTKYIGDAATVLAANIGDTPFTIQARALPFNPADVVPLVMKVATAGSYTIGIDHVNGLFADGQTVYLRDNLTAQLHNLGQGAYSFTTAAGTFNNRFDVVYSTDAALSAPGSEMLAENVMVYAENGALQVKSSVGMNKIEVFDVRGRLIYKENNMRNTDVEITSITAQKQMLVMKVFTNQGVAVKKVIY
ncbi:MAG: autotransporter-associated beta strand repeat-containing protein [Flavobacterium sp.]